METRDINIKTDNVKMSAFNAIRNMVAHIPGVSVGAWGGPHYHTSVWVTVPADIDEITLCNLIAAMQRAAGDSALIFRK